MSINEITTKISNLAKSIFKSQNTSLQNYTTAPDNGGVYALFRNNELVYVGKAKKQTTLRKRLSEHFKKINERENISSHEMNFRYIPMNENWITLAVEDYLIESFCPAWNKTGFGNHNPGKGRPGIKISKWDKQFPKKIT